MTEYEPFDVDAVDAGTHVGKFGGYVWAGDWDGAEGVCRRRRIGERVMGVIQRKASPAPYQRPSGMLKARMTPVQKIEFLHGVCFLSFLASRSIGASVFDILGDRGIMHEAIHAMQIGRPARKDMAEQLSVIERKVPGYWPGTGA